MTTTTNEKLQRIRAKCNLVLAANEKEPHTLLSTHVASLRSTIAAIDGLMHDYKLRRRFEVDPDVLTYKPLMDIIAAWSEELL